ncbi:MAG: hypothetical protein NVSMB16_08580 [Acidimicrobiales bacterium]
MTGAAYSLIAVSITLMFRSTGVLSFAHAAFAAVGAYVYGDLAGARHWPHLPAAGLALVVTVAYGLIVERTAIRPVRNGSAVTKLIVTLGVLSVTTGLLEQIYGFQPSSAPLLLPNRSIAIAGVRISYQQVAVLVIAGVLALVLGLFLQKTRFGTAIRAVAQNAETARLMGVSLDQIARFNWALGAFLAGLTGILVASLSVVTLGTFPLLLAKALIATLFGGLVSLPLTFLGGLVLGVVESVVTLHSTMPGAQDLAALVVVVALLVGRRHWPIEVEAKEVFGERARVAMPGIETIRRWGTAARTRVRPLLRPFTVPVAVAAVAGGVFVPATSNYWGFVGARGLFYVIEALSLVLLSGWAGQVSLMHGAYVGIGAFMTSYLVVSHGMPLPLALLIGATVGMVMGLVAGLPALRLSGLQFGIASLTFSAAASEWLFHRPQFPHDLPRGSFFGISLVSDSHVFLIMLPITVLLFLVVRNLRRSTFGALLISARDAGPTVAHFGADPKRARMWAFALASFIASLGGGLYGVLLGGFQPADFTFLLSITLLLFAVVGGVQSLAGPVIAGLLFGVVPQLLQGNSGTSASAIPDIVSGLLVVVLMAVRPGGLASVLRSGPRAGVSDTKKYMRAGRFDAVTERHRPAPETAPRHPVPTPVLHTAPVRPAIAGETTGQRR